MPTTFRSGPRDPVTGRSSATISSGNIVRASGQTDNERAAREASYTSYEPAAVQASERNAVNEANYQQFLRDTGRSSTNPYGNEGIVSRLTGISPDKVNYTNNLGAAGIEAVNRLAYDQFLNPLDNRGRVRGMLREGSPTRYGAVFRDPNYQRDEPTGLASLARFLPGAGLFSAISRGRDDLTIPMAFFSPDAARDSLASGIMPSMDLPGSVSSLPEVTSPLPSNDDDSSNDLMPAPAAPAPVDEKKEEPEKEDLNPFFISPLQDPDPVTATDPVPYMFDEFGNVVFGELQGPPQLRMDEIATPGSTTIQGIFDFPGTVQDRTFRATSTGTGTEPLAADDLLNSYLEVTTLPMKIEIKLIPDGLDPAKEIQDGIPVDKMVNGGGDDGSCPVATQDVQTNEENKRLAVKEHQYGPTINPETACGVCAYYNVSPQMQQCMKDDSGEVGYCQLLKFMCAADNSCAAFEEGGPITEIM